MPRPTSTPNQEATRPTWPMIHEPISGSALASQPVAVSSVRRSNAVVGKTALFVVGSNELVATRMGTGFVVEVFGLSVLAASFSRSFLSKGGG